MITPAFAALPPPFADALLPSPTPVTATVGNVKVAALEMAKPSSLAALPAADAEAGRSSQVMSTGEWDDLFGAVLARLQGAARTPVPAPMNPFVIGGAVTQDAVVRECGQALGLLHVLLVQQRQQAGTA